MGMYSSYATFKYKMFAFDLGNIILYSTHGYSNPSLSSTDIFIDNILCTKSLVTIFARDYSFSNPELASCTVAKFSHFLNSGQQSSLLWWSGPWHTQQRPWRESVILSSFSSFLDFGSRLYHVSDHPAGLEAVSFQFFSPMPPLVATEPPLVAELSLATEPRELDLWENFEEDCCCLLSCLDFFSSVLNISCLI